MSEKPILFSGAMVRAILDGRKSQTRRVVKPQPLDRLHAIWKRFPNQQGCPYGKPGDRLWVRETFFHLDDFHGRPCTWYRADGNAVEGYWRPSIHMPRRASRITLAITGVRVERLQEISDYDAQQEGINKCLDPRVRKTDYYRAAFCALWDSINGKKYPWASNPWVWVIEFKKL